MILRDPNGHEIITLRDQFAISALAGLLAANAMYGGRTDNRAALANDAYQTADALLAARKRNPDAHTTT